MSSSRILRGQRRVSNSCPATAASFQSDCALCRETLNAFEWDSNLVRRSVYADWLIRSIPDVGNAYLETPQRHSHRKQFSRSFLDDYVRGGSSTKTELFN